MYHSIAVVDNRRFQPFAVPPRVFATQMAYLHQHGYTPVTVTQLMQIYAGHAETDKQFPERPVVLTFDDGFADFFTHALPILQQYRFRATLYVPTAFVGQTSRWLRREGEQARPMLTWEQIREIHNAGIECGGHTHHHVQLDILPPSRANEEIRQCKQLLEQHLGHPVFSFAYPFGYYTRSAKQCVQDAGYTSACAVGHRISSVHSDPLALTRFIVKPTTTLADFQGLLNGTSLSALESTYLHLRTSLWQIVRRSSALIQSHLEKKNAGSSSNNL